MRISKIRPHQLRCDWLKNHWRSWWSQLNVALIALIFGVRKIWLLTNIIREIRILAQEIPNTRLGNFFREIWALYSEKLKLDSRNSNVFKRASLGSPHPQWGRSKPLWAGSISSSIDFWASQMWGEGVESERFAWMVSGLVVPDMDAFKIWSQLFIYFSASVYLMRHYILDLNITLIS